MKTIANLFFSLHADYFRWKFEREIFHEIETPFNKEVNEVIETLNMYDE